MINEYFDDDDADDAKTGTLQMIDI